MKFQIAQSFCLDGDIDERAFALGVEWGVAWQKANGAAPFVTTVHEDNVVRLEAMLRGQRRSFTVKRGQGWATIAVAGLA